jgi:hypothetical protein
VHQFLAEKNIPLTNQQQFFSDLFLGDLLLFYILKMDLKGGQFSTMEDIKSDSMIKLQNISKEAFDQCFQQW